MAGTQACSAEGCSAPAAFSTRAKPAWCEDCITGMARRGGLQPAESFTGPRNWWLTSCLKCQTQAHYRFEYILDQHAIGEPVCRACFWRKRAAELRQESWRTFERELLNLLRRFRPEEILEAAVSSSHDVPVERVREYLKSGWWWRERIFRRADDSEFDLVELFDEVNDDNDPVVVKCRRCGRLEPKRICDLGWGCSCSRNTRAQNPGSPREKKVLLTESSAEALKWFDHKHNDSSTLDSLTTTERTNCTWLCPTCSATFEAAVVDMVKTPSCPSCKAARDEDLRDTFDRWRVTPVSEVPELVAAWIDEADPRTVMVAGDWRLRRFECQLGHRPMSAPSTFLRSGCPSCRSLDTQREKRFVAETLPEIAAQWHPTRNGRYTPSNVVWDSKRTIWWRAECCGHEWEESVRNRDKYQRLRCPACKTILGSLAWCDPGLAAEWSDRNPVNPWKIRPHATVAFVPEWICARNSQHVWTASASSRSNGAECPECRETGKSRVELDHLAAAKAEFGGVRSGRTFRHPEFSSRKSWTADISFDVNGRFVVVEYDGRYWHGTDAKALVDRSKSLDLLAAGYIVVRLRERGLPSLCIDHSSYTEFIVHPSTPQPHGVMRKTSEWLEQKFAPTTI